MKNLLIHLSGRVQGIGLRASIREQAIGLDLAGWVKNNPNGTVLAVIQGEEKDVERFLSWLETEEYSSFIQQKQVEEQTPDPTFKTFGIRQ